MISYVFCADLSCYLKYGWCGTGRPPIIALAKYLLRPNPLRVSLRYCQRAFRRHIQRTNHIISQFYSSEPITPNPTINSPTWSSPTPPPTTTNQPSFVPSQSPTEFPFIFEGIEDAIWETERGRGGNRVEEDVV